MLIELLIKVANHNKHSFDFIFYSAFKVMQHESLGYSGWYGQLTLSIISYSRFFSFFCIKIPNSYGISRAKWWLNFVRVATIWPEEHHAIKYWFYVHYLVWPTLGENSQQTTNGLQRIVSKSRFMLVINCSIEQFNTFASQSLLQ